MPKFVDVDSLHFPNICIFDMKLHGVTVPMVRLVDLQKLVPAADVVEVRHGRWSVDEIHTHGLSYGTTAYEPVYKCSVCGRLTESYLRYDEPIMPEDADFPHYCPHCGADMRPSAE